MKYVIKKELKKIMKDRNWSEMELALNLGITETTVKRWLKGDEVKWLVIKGIENILKVEIKDENK